MLWQKVLARRLAGTPFGAHSLRPVVVTIALVFEHGRLCGGVMVSAPKRSRSICLLSGHLHGRVDAPHMHVEHMLCRLLLLAVQKHRLT